MPSTRVERHPTWLVNRASAHAQRLLADAFAASGTRGYHYRLLVALDEHGPGSQAQLGRLTGIDRSDVVAAVDALVPEGLAKREPDPADRRRNIITLTRPGAKRLRVLDRVVAGVQDELLAPLSERERATLVRLL